MPSGREIPPLQIEASERHVLHDDGGGGDGGHGFDLNLKSSVCQSTPVGGVFAFRILP